MRIVDLRRGDALGSYHLRRPLGRGGTARVWLGVHRDTGAQRALKVLDHDDDEVAARFVNEGHVASRLRHPNVVPVLEVVLAPAALVLEFVDGPTLAELAAVRRLSIPELDAVAAGLFDGVAAIHGAGVIHRDLKPANVLLEPSAHGLVVRVTDFGIAKALDAPGLTRPQAAFGSPAYMAPEQFDDAGAVDARADLFSLGCVLYELAAGFRAFSAPDLASFRAAVRCGPVRPLAEVRPDLPERMTQLVTSCLEADRAARPADCATARGAWQLPAELAPVAWGEADRRRLATHRRGQTHPDPDRLADPQLEPEDREHLAGCAQCRIDRARILSAEIEEDTDAEELERRRAVFDSVWSALQANARLVTLTGPGGVGKSWLADRIGRRWRDERGAVVVHGLVEVRDELSLARAIPQVPDGPALWILDDCDRALAVLAGRLPGWLAAHPELVVVATSREALRVAHERIVPVTPLDPTAARALFEDIARRVRPDLDAARWHTEIAAIVDRLDGLPLAIELVASRIRAMSPPEILARLDRILQSPGRRRDLAPRHSTLRDTFDWSWALLTGAEQRALAQCSVFCAGFEMRDAEGVLDLSAADPDRSPWVPDVVHDLVGKSLLRMDASGRYSLFECLREYAAERLDATAREAVAERHQRHFCEASSDGELVHPDRLWNQVAATRRAARSSDPLTAARAAAQLGRRLDLLR